MSVMTDLEKLTLLMSEDAARAVRAGYALSELGRGGEWPAAGMQRLEKLAGTGGNHG